VVDLDDDEVSLHRPDIQAPGNASATLNLAKIGVIASKAAVSRSHLYASLM